MISSMIGRMHHVVLDCPDPAALAAFYSALLGLPVTYRDDEHCATRAAAAGEPDAYAGTGSHACLIRTAPARRWR
jgi:catechol 2,3-dioxygenase-like lactoylglutathione lyase family enzyme